MEAMMKLFEQNTSVWMWALIGLFLIVSVMMVYTYSILKFRSNPGFENDDVDYSAASGSFDLGAHQARKSMSDANAPLETNSNNRAA